MGSLLSSDGRIGSELSRRLGMARAELDKLHPAWSHSSLNTKRKVNIFSACIATRLLYGLQAASLNKTERRRLDGFYARCLRRILKMPPSHAFVACILQLYFQCSCLADGTSAMSQRAAPTATAIVFRETGCSRFNACMSRMYFRSKWCCTTALE